MDIRALIEKQKAELDSRPVSVADVVMAGELVEVEVSRADGATWQRLVADFPPRAGSTPDAVCNMADLPADYPVARLRVADQELTQDEWREFYGALDGVSRNVIGVVIWKTNALDPMTELMALGKAKAGGSSDSPANRASRRAASKGGSPRKSRSTTTTKKAE